VYFEGEWKDDEPNGIGIMKFSNGLAFAGTWKGASYSSASYQNKGSSF
jgi:hypothetical protein